MNAGLAISGAREGSPSGLRRLLARAAAHKLSALVAPGSEIARAAGLDLEAAGLPLATGPREASVLVVVGRLPEPLERAAEVAYAQMPRPRAALVIGAEDFDSLPADVRCEPEQTSLAEAVRQLRQAFREGAFAARTRDFEAPALETRTVYTCSMHPEVEQEEPGQCPECGMDLVPRESTGDAGEQHDHGHEDHVEDGQEAGEHAGDSEGGGHDHGGHEEMDFMSMVEMTQGTPRSSDGLQMEWVEAPFGPLLPGLAGGLSLSLTLDGDTVAEARAEALTGEAGKLLYGPAPDLPGRLSALDPLSPISYRLLATLALEDASGASAVEEERYRRLAALELERAASHAGWISGFAHLLGLDLLSRDAARLEITLRRLLAAPLEPDMLDHGRPESESLSRRLNSRLLRRLLRSRLRGVGVLEAEDAATAGGPVARAAGRLQDLRAGDETYEALGFEPVLGDGSDALARLRLRAAELEQSLRLARAALGRLPEPARKVEAARFPDSGSGRAIVETPRGPAALSLALDGGEVAEARLQTPSEALLALAGTVAEGRELGDALAGVASLDISPWGNA